MIIFDGSTCDEVYNKAVKTLLEQPIINGTKEVCDAVLYIDDNSKDFVHFPHREISDTYKNAELEWYWTADNSCRTIGKFAKMWLRLSDDGITNNSAYGYILFKKYGFNQLEQIIELLKSDPATRRAVLNISDLCINRITTKDMQCTVSIQFLLRNNKLNATVYMRSNDIYFGYPYDYLFFTSIQRYIAARLNINVGKYTHFVGSLHMYARDIEKFIIIPYDTHTVSLDASKYYNLYEKRILNI